MAATIVVTVQVAFDGATFIDISANCTRATIGYGRSRLLDEFNSGSARITYDNRDNSLTPGHSDSTYGNTQLIGREVRISSAVTGGSDEHSTYLFRGQITDLDYRAGFDTSTVTISVTDGFDRLGKAQVFDQTFSEQDCGARVSAVLDLASVNYPSGSSPLDRSIAKGTTTTPAVGAGSEITDNCLDYIQQLTRTESGRFLINHAGTPSATNFGGILSWFSQNTGTTDRGISFSDAKTLPSGSVQMASLDLEFGSELLFNAYQFTDSGGTISTGSDSASVAKYGERTIKRTLLANTASTNNAGIYFINLYAEPALRISSVTTDVDAMSTADAERTLHFNVMSSTTLSYLPPGSSATLTGQYVIEGVNYDITVRDMATNSARIKATYKTSAADTTGYWVLGDPVLGDFPTILAPG